MILNISCLGFGYNSFYFKPHLLQDLMSPSILLIFSRHSQSLHNMKCLFRFGLCCRQWRPGTYGRSAAVNLLMGFLWFISLVYKFLVFSSLVRDVVICKSSHRFGIYLHRHWAKHLAKVCAGKQGSLEHAIKRMTLDYGPSREVWAIHEEKLQVPPVPPRPHRFSFLTSWSSFCRLDLGFLWLSVWTLCHGNRSSGSWEPEQWLCGWSFGVVRLLSAQFNFWLSYLITSVLFAVLFWRVPSLTRVPMGCQHCDLWSPGFALLGSRLYAALLCVMKKFFKKNKLMPCT